MLNHKFMRKTLSIVIIVFWSISMITGFAPPLIASTPTLIQPEISIQNGTAYVLANNGTVWSWDKNSVISEAQVGAVSVTSGDGFAFIIKSDGTVWGWGENRAYELGNGTTSYYPIDSKYAVQVTGLTDIISVAAGHNFSLALKKDGTVWTWGTNFAWTGQLDAPPVPQYFTTPVQVSGLTNITALSASYEHALALKADGTVWSWGFNGSGAVGDISGFYIDQPFQVPELKGITAIGTGQYHSLAVGLNGQVWSWGQNREGQLGDGTTIGKLNPVLVKGLIGVKAVAGGADQSLALLQDGTVYEWGQRFPYPSTSSPQLVSDLSQVQSVSVGALQRFALRKDGTIWGWGYNKDGGIGDGTQLDRAQPVKNVVDTNPSPIKLVSVTPTDGSSLVYNDSQRSIRVQLSENIDFAASPIIKLMDENGVEAPARLNINQENRGGLLSVNIDGDLIPGMTYTLHFDNLKDVAGFTRQEPINIQYKAQLSPNNLAQDQSLSAGGMHSLGIFGAKVMAWGDNRYGQLGDGTDIPRNIPIPVPGFEGWQIQAVAAGSLHSLALDRDGTLWAWGDNDYGQLGIGSTQEQKQTAQAIPIPDVGTMAAGVTHSLAVDFDGQVWAWGGNNSGQVGDGSTSNRRTPILLTGLNHITAVAAGGSHSLALKYDGTIWAWGDNEQGQLGDGTRENRQQAILVPGLTEVVAISAGENHSLALKKDGTVWAWGDNSNGQLGIGETIKLSATPVQISTLKNIFQISAGSNFSYALCRDWVGVQWNLYGWGNNEYDQLELMDDKGSIISTPEVLPEEVKFVSAGGVHTIMRGRGPGNGYNTIDYNALMGWGINNSGQVGNGTFNHAPYPTRIIEKPPIYIRAAGLDASETAVRIAKVGWNYGASAAVVVNERAYADALPGTVLAAAFNAPILLTGATTLSTSTNDELISLSPKTVFILGGTAVVSLDIEKQLKAKYKNVIRIGGSDQYETAAKIAEYLQQNDLVTPGKAVLAYGESFPDALAVSSLAAYQHIPILLTKTHTLSAYTQQAIKDLQVKETTVVGGSAVIGQEVTDQLPGVRRFSGKEKYDTAVSVAQGMNADLVTVFVATGENFPDALAGSVLAARTNSPILLVNQDLPKAPAELVFNNSQTIREVIVLGGEAVVSDIVLDKIYARLTF